MKIPRPVNDQLIVELLKPANETAGGIQLPDSSIAEGDVRRGKVIAAGPGRISEYTPLPDQDLKSPNYGPVQLMPMNAKRGDIVILGTRGEADKRNRDPVGGKRFKADDGRELWLVQDQFVLAIEE